ncbi:hypothetical protein HDU76_007152 [Blyttiomyces sp. JEL0837]|nr:hypothetical protein HDU76_007152 [Blyttiomyces sp. JEL0837]
MFIKMISVMLRYDLRILDFTETGVKVRLLFNVLGTKLPIPWLTAGLAVPPTIIVSNVVPASQALYNNKNNNPGTRTTPAFETEATSDSSTTANDAGSASNREGVWDDVDVNNVGASRILSLHGLPSGHVVTPLCKVKLSDPITLSGEDDLWIQQEEAVVTILDVGAVKGFVKRFVVQQGAVDGILVRINFKATIQVLGQVLYEDLSLDKVVNLAEVQERKAAALEKYLAELAQKEKEKEQQSPSTESESNNSSSASTAAPSESGIPTRTETPTVPEPDNDVDDASTVNDNDSVKDEDVSVDGGKGEKKPSRVGRVARGVVRGIAGVLRRRKKPAQEGSAAGESPNTVFDADVDPVSTNVAEQSPSQSRRTPMKSPTPEISKRKKRRPTELRSPADGPLPGLQITPLPVESTLTTISTGLLLGFKQPPAITIRLAAITFDVQLNRSTVASGLVSGLHLHDETTSTAVLVEIVPAVISRPVHGLWSSAKGVLRGALNGTVSGLLGGEWGSGSTVIRIVNWGVLDGTGKRIKWVEEILEAVEVEHDLDAVRRIGGAVRGGVRDVKDGVLGMIAGVLAAGGNRCKIL